ncbi:ABC transporter permease [Insolitispirillum peregrinum]|uniref:Amino acid ABC transporter membrane protein 2, PAAT family n=1 Tax=Insolitispirillum peregrinum TaxID=80876 RepID=A0A1N7JG41_9PROT|nr:ABC transporter permease [Insolitispirillum peregrinum]SIS48268.1 amino acid ABC transporter membrane protein 2, PAAT family [Insolitispirillum peregrinum]
MNWTLMWDSLPRLLAALPLTLTLVFAALACGGVIAFVTALLRLSDYRPLVWTIKTYVFAFRGTPLLVQIFLLYYGLGQFDAVRTSVLWPFLREPLWCAILALSLNTGAYTCEILRGALQSVPAGQVEAARACGMSRTLAFRRIVLPIAFRQMLPTYGNEIILMVKASSLASTITMMELTGVARKIIAQSFAVFEIFILAGVIYLALNFVASQAIRLGEKRLQPCG